MEKGKIDDAQEYVDKATMFLLDNYEAEIKEQDRLGKNFIVIDFMAIARIDYDLANSILEEPENFLKIFSVATASIAKKLSTWFVRFKNLPKTQLIPIRHMRKEHIGKMVVIEGVVRQKSDVRPKTKIARFICPHCGVVMPILQTEKKMKEPSMCSGCAKKGKFKIISSDDEDTQWLQIEETMEEMLTHKSSKMRVLLEADLTSPLSEHKAVPGSKVRLVGILNKEYVELKDGAKSTTSDLFIEANYIEPMEEAYDELKITHEDTEKILDVSKKNPFKLMTDAILPNVYGYNHIKNALVLQCVGGVRTKREGDSALRGDIHVLLIGDPGVAKSAMLKRIVSVWPKARYVVAASMTGVGLTGAVVKDEFMRGYTLEAGALSLANKGLCAIDELDKTEPEETNKLHEAMEQQQVTIIKANINETLPAETTILAACNPKHGRFDKFESEISQTELPSTLLNRFDLIYIIKDNPDEVEDSRKAMFVLKRRSAARQEEELSLDNPFNDVKFFQKYIAYAKLHCKPLLVDESPAMMYLHDFYQKMRHLIISDDNGKYFKSVTINIRQLDGLARLAEACARVRLSDTVELVDAENAVKVYDECMSRIAVDKETGHHDVDMVSGAQPTSKRNQNMMVYETVRELSKLCQNGQVPMEDIIKTMSQHGLNELEIENHVELLKRGGSLFEPRPGFLQINEVY